MYNQIWIKRTFFADLKLAFNQWRLALALYTTGLIEHKKTSGFGLVMPFVSVFFYVAILGAVMSLVFHESSKQFIPFFAISFSVWQQVSNAISDGAHANEFASRYTAFPHVSGLIIHLKALCEFFIALLLKIFAAIIIVSVVNTPIVFQANYVALLIGITMLSLVFFSWSLPIAFLFDRFRILRGFLPQFLFIIYLVTPILWEPTRLNAHPWVMQYNPILHLIEIVRIPFLYHQFPVISYMVAGGFIIIGGIVSYFSFSANRSLVVFRWLA